MINNNNDTRDQIVAAIYARVSSQKQADQGTIESQVAALRRRVMDDGLALKEPMCFIDNGCSGSTLIRPELEKLRDAAAAGSVDRVYVHSPDRLARNYAYQFLLMEELERCGVEVVFLNRSLGSSPEDTLLLQVQGMLAEYERTKIVERARRGKLHAARNGSVSVLGTAPYGYRYVGKYEGGGVAALNVKLEEAQVVRQIFQWVGLERLSLTQTCRRLQQQKTASPRGAARWSCSTVRSMLANPTYKGQAGFGKKRIGPRRPRVRPPRNGSEPPRRPHSNYEQPSGQWVTIAVPAIVEEELFEAAGEQLQENRKRQRERIGGAGHLLSGLTVCGCCRYAMYVVSRRSGDKCHRYYRCGGTDRCRHGGQRLCWNKSVCADALEEQVWADVRNMLEDPSRITREYDRRLAGEDPCESSPQSGKLESAEKKVGRAIERLIDAYADGILDKQEFQTRITAARERQRNLKEQVTQQKQQEAERREMRLVIGQLEEFAKRVTSGLGEADSQTRREIIRLLVRQVEIDRNEIRIVYRLSDPPKSEHLSPQTEKSQHCASHHEDSA
jgi:site-specific DNA recombinase